MASHDRCHRCQELPLATSARGIVHRCPLCAGQVIRNGDTTCRIEDAAVSGNAGLGRRAVPTVLGTLAALLLVGALIAAICYATLRTMEHSRLITSARMTSQVDDDWSNFTIPPPTPLPVHVGVTEVDVPRTVQVSPTPSASARIPQRIAKGRPAVELAAAADEGRGHARIFLPDLPQQHLTELLEQTPEVGLVAAPLKPPFPQYPPSETRSKEENAALAAKHREQLVSLMAHKDDLVHQLIKTRGGLAGLPFLLGKDCEISTGRAAELAQHSAGMREMLSETTRRTTFGDSEFQYVDPKYFAKGLLGSHKLARGEGVPAYHQILSGEDGAMRMALVLMLEELGGKEAVRALAKRAVFDNSEAVRKRAIQALKDVPAATLAPDFLAALRYPFAPIANNAAEALVALKMKDTAPELVKMLDQPDPSEPERKKVDGAQTFVRREVVRINHMRNCLLCHAPLAKPGRSDNEVAGLVPTFGTPVPPRTSTVYYAERAGGIFVRADTTYLRQDFSVLQTVLNADPWPVVQRFDFLVRERVLTASELDDWQQQQEMNAFRPMSQHRRALLFALQSLTGAELGNDAAAWKNYLASR